MNRTLITIIVIAGVAVLAFGVKLGASEVETIKLESAFRNSLRELNIAIQADDGPVVDAKLSEIFKLRSNPHYSVRNEKRFQNVISTNELAFFRNSILQFKKDMDSMQLDSKYGQYVSTFPNAAHQKQFEKMASSLKRERQDKRAAEEKRQVDEQDNKDYMAIMSSDDYDKALTLFSDFSQKYPKSVHMDELNSHIEQLNIEKLKSIQGINENGKKD
jgi:hypothetical protein